jgi:HEAT repeat protein
VSLALLCVGCGGSSEERRVAIYDLQADPTPANIQRIRALLDDPDPEVRATALNTLVGLDVPDAEALAVAGLGDPDGFVRSIAVKRLGDLEAAAQLEPVKEVLLADPDPWARKTAAESLEQIDGEQAIAALIRAFQDPMPEVRLAAARGVRNLAPARGLPGFVRLLLDDPEWEIRVQAAAGLGAAGDPGARPALEQALGDEVEQVRSAAANALRLLGAE